MPPADTVDLALRSDVKAAKKSIEDFGKFAKSSLEDVEKSFGALESVAKGAVAVFVSGKLFGAIKNVTSAATVQQDAVKRLNTALKLSGDFSTQASRDMQAFASKLQSVTTIGDETYLSQLALAKSFGLSNDQAKNLVKAAADLSAATGTSLDSAVVNLAKTFGGLTGELGETIPALKNLSAEQLKAGAGLDYVAKRFGGAAQAMSEEFGGSVIQTENLFKGFQESLGSLVTKNPVIIKVIKTIGKGFSELSKYIDDNADSIREFINDGIRAVINTAPDFILFARSVVKTLEIIATAFTSAEGDTSKFKESLSFEGVIDGLDILVVGFFEAVRKILQALRYVIKPLEGFFSNDNIFGAAFDEAIKKVETLQESLVKLSGESFKDLKENAEKVDGPFGTLLQTLQKLKKEVNGLGNTTPSPGQGTDNGIGAKGGDQNTSPSNQPNALSGLEGLSSLNKDVFKQMLGPFGDTQKMKSFGASIGTSFAQNFLRGADGAKQFIGDFLGAFADIFLPGLGQFLGPIFTQLATLGPEGAKQMVMEFADALPEVVDILVEAIPVVAVALAEKADVIISALVQLIPKVALALAEAFFRMIPIIIQNLMENISFHIDHVGEAFTKWGQELRIVFDKIGKMITEPINAIGKQLELLGQGIAEIPGKLAEGAKQFIEELLKKVGEVASRLTPGGSDGKIGGTLGQIGEGIKGALGFATGGIVVGSGTSDSVPALLAPGELVIDRTTGPRLNRFMDNYQAAQEPSQSVEVTNAILARILEAVSAPVSVQTTAEVNGRAFADIMLMLSRTNQRTA